MAAGSRGQSPGLGRTAAVREEEFHKQANNGESERPLIPLQGDFFHPAFHFIFGHKAQFFAVNRVQSFCAASHGNVEAIGGFCYFPQGGFVQFRSDGSTGLIPDHVAASIGQLDRNGGSVRAPNPNRVDGHSLFCLLSGGFQSVTLKILAIGDEDQNTVVISLLIKKPRRLIDGAGDIRPLFGNQVGINRIQRLPERIVVAGQGTERESTAGEGDEADAVSFQTADKVMNAQPGPFEAVGAKVFCQHTAGGIHRK